MLKDKRLTGENVYYYTPNSQKSFFKKGERYVSQFKKIGKNVKRQFTKEIQMVSEHMKKYSTKLLCKEMQLDKGVIFPPPILTGLIFLTSKEGVPNSCPL